jgi:hypothetical protein
MQAAWGMVLGRLKTGVVAATGLSAAAKRRAARPKRQTSRSGVET